MKNTVIGFIILILIGLAYTNLPWQWRRQKDIEHGNQLVAQLEQYQQQHHKLPENTDEPTLKQIGFVKNKQGWQPAYEKLDNTRYQIVYQDGYDAPFLTWQSDKKAWALLP